jgi:hypothetical protein
MTLVGDHEKFKGENMFGFIKRLFGMSTPKATEKTTEPKLDLNKLTKPQLSAMAKARGLKVLAKDTKAQLIAKLEA